MFLFHLEANSNLKKILLTFFLVLMLFFCCCLGTKPQMSWTCLVSLISILSGLDNVSVSVGMVLNTTLRQLEWKARSRKCHD